MTMNVHLHEHTGILVLVMENGKYPKILQYRNIFLITRQTYLNNKTVFQRPYRSQTKTHVSKTFMFT